MPRLADDVRVRKMPLPDRPKNAYRFHFPRTGVYAAFTNPTTVTAEDIYTAAYVACTRAKQAPLHLQLVRDAVFTDDVSVEIRMPEGTFEPALPESNPPELLPKYLAVFDVMREIDSLGGGATEGQVREMLLAKYRVDKPKTAVRTWAETRYGGTGQETIGQETLWREYHNRAAPGKHVPESAETPEAAREGRHARLKRAGQGKLI